MPPSRIGDELRVSIPTQLEVDGKLYSVAALFLSQVDALEWRDEAETEGNSATVVKFPSEDVWAVYVEDNVGGGEDARD